jgi:hypothetical protein
LVKRSNDCGESFAFTTYLYGHQLDEYEIPVLEEIYPNEAIMKFWGK